MIVRFMCQGVVFHKAYIPAWCVRIEFEHLEYVPFAVVHKPNGDMNVHCKRIK